MPARVKVVDLTSEAESGESVAMVYFEELNGIVHIYRDGTVVLSSPKGSTVTSFRQSDSHVRHTLFLGMLARLGASEQELASAAQMISQREKVLEKKGFPAAVEQAAKEAAEHFRAWCLEHDLDPDTVDEADLEHLLDQAIQQVRAK